MGSPQRVGRDDVNGRDLFVLDLPTAQDLPDTLQLASPKFACLYCERVHDIIDEEAVGIDPDPAHDSVVMTTWHDKEPLAEAILFAIQLSVPDRTYIDDCRATIGISIGSTTWAEEIRWAFSR